MDRIEHPHQSPPEPDPRDTHRQWIEGVRVLESALAEFGAACQILEPLNGDGVNGRLAAIRYAFADVLPDVRDDRDAAGRTARRTA